MNAWLKASRQSADSSCPLIQCSSAPTVFPSLLCPSFPLSPYVGPHLSQSHSIIRSFAQLFLNLSCLSLYPYAVVPSHFPPRSVLFSDSPKLHPSLAYFLTPSPSLYPLSPLHAHPVLQLLCLQLPAQGSIYYRLIQLTHTNQLTASGSPF